MIKDMDAFSPLKHSVLLITPRNITIPRVNITMFTPKPLYRVPAHEPATSPDLFVCAFGSDGVIALA
jgi:hypothetical protein